LARGIEIKHSAQWFTMHDLWWDGGYLGL